MTIPRDPAREAARRELSKQMYHQNDPSLVQRALDAIWNWIDKLFGTASEAAPGGTLGLLVVVLAVLVVGAALWWRLGTPRRQPGSAAPCSRTAPAARPNTARPPKHTQPRDTGTPPCRNACAPSSAPWRNGPCSTPAPAAPPTRPSRKPAAHCPRTPPNSRAAAAHFDDVTYGGRGASEQSYRRIAELDRELERTRPVLTSSAHSTAHHTSQGAAE